MPTVIRRRRVKGEDFRSGQQVGFGGRGCVGQVCLFVCLFFKGRRWGGGRVEGGRSGTPIYPWWEVKRGDNLRQWMLDVCAENAGTLTCEPRVPTLPMTTPTHTTHPPSLSFCPPRDRWRQTDGRRAPLLGQTTVVWRDAAQLKSTQLRMADMDRCTQDTPRPKRKTDTKSVKGFFGAWPLLVTKTRLLLLLTRLS